MSLNDLQKTLSTCRVMPLKAFMILNINSHNIREETSIQMTLIT